MVYLTHGHLDVTYYVGVVSRFMTFPQSAHRDAIKHNVLCYMTGMLDFDILYKKGDDNKVTWFVNADFKKWDNQLLDTYFRTHKLV